LNARRVDVGALAAADVPAAVLQECHAQVMRRMESVRARVTFADGRALIVQAVLPGVARVRDGRREQLLRDGEVVGVDGGAVEARVAAEVRDVVDVVDAAAFGPLHRAVSCADGGGGFTLTDGSGATYGLQLHEGTLLPSTLRYGDDEVHVDDYLHTQTTWIARALRHPRLGACRVLFEDGGVVFGEGFFAPAPAEVDPVRGHRAEGDPSRQMRTPLPGVVVETQSPTPIVVDGKATRLVLLPDPGDWKARHRAYRPVIEELERQDQRIAGFPLLFVDGAQSSLMAAPFRARKRGAAFDPPAGYALADVPEGRLLVVYPQEGDVAAKTQSGRLLLERALANRKLTAQGPIVAQPFLHLHEDAPDAARLGAAKVRVWVRIE